MKNGAEYAMKDHGMKEEDMTSNGWPGTLPR
jgi:hypothetical protein